MNGRRVGSTRAGYNVMQRVIVTSLTYDFVNFGQKCLPMDMFWIFGGGEPLQLASKAKSEQAICLQRARRDTQPGEKRPMLDGLSCPGLTP